jgi:hypothetical protein
VYGAPSAPRTCMRYSMRLAEGSPSSTNS